MQAVPIPYSCVRDVRETFMDCAESAGIELLEIPKHSDLKQVACSPSWLHVAPHGCM